MLRNYLRIALRNFGRQPGYSFINIFGLATGMAAFVLIALYVQNELSFDAHNPIRNDVYRVVLDAEIANQSILTVSSPAVMAGAFIEAFPEVIDATRISEYSSEMLITVEDRPFYEAGFFLADSSVFSLFALTLVEGDPATALNQPNTIVVSESIATKYFGKESAIGRALRFDNRVDYEITGVMKDPPQTSHFRPQLIGSFLTDRHWNDTEWLNNSFATYIRLLPGSDPDDLIAKFPDFLRTNLGPHMLEFIGQDYDQLVASGMRYMWQLERLGDIYLHSRADDQIGPTGDIRYLYILGFIAMFVLLIACVNFMNLSTARATGRAREVGVRKVLGSDRLQLVNQFLGESTIMALVAMVIAFGIVLIALPSFSKLAGADIRIHLWLVGVMGVTAIFTGIVAGLYPAFVLSSFDPAAVLKGSFSSSRRGTKLRSALVVFQFVVTIILLVGTTVVFKQLRFIQSQDLGFEPMQVVVVPIETESGVINFETFRSQLLSSPAIKNAAAAGILPGPGRIHSTTGFRGERMKSDDVFIAARGEVSKDYVETLGLQMVAGRDFDPEYSGDSLSWVINEATATKLGLTPQEAVGTRLTRLDDGDGRVGTIIGVTANAHYASMHQRVQPIVLGNWASNQRYGLVKIQADRVGEALSLIESTKVAFEPGYPFRYYFLDSDYQKFYDREQRLGTLYLLFTALAIVIACLGLFGLASFVTSQRAREIGVRKALGASIAGIVLLLSKEFTTLVLIACGIAFPLSWFAMNRWLEGFAYATSMGWSLFAIAGAAAIVIAWITVSYQSIRAAVADPVVALHHE